MLIASFAILFAGCGEEVVTTTTDPATAGAEDCGCTDGKCEACDGDCKCEEGKGCCGECGGKEGHVHADGGTHAEGASAKKEEMKEAGSSLKEEMKEAASAKKEEVKEAASSLKEEMAN